MTQQEIQNFLKEHPGYLAWGKSKLANKFGVSEEVIKSIKKRISNPVDGKIEWDEIVETKNDSIPYYYKVEEFKLQEERRILIVGDLHAPFTRKNYLAFCEEIYNKYSCNQVIFIGDLIDNHFSSFHETDPDGHSAAEELRLAKLEIARWYKTFPFAKVCIGNHDAIPARKSFNGGLSKMWLRSISEVLNTPNWEFSEEFVMDDVLYIHGIGRKAVGRMNADITSIVQGHYHSEGYINYTVGRTKKLFSMQVGCGVDDKSYAMAYGRYFDKMHISCGVVLENGNLPILEYMKL